MIEPNIIRKQRRTLAILLVLTVATAITGMAMGYGALSFDRLIPTLIGQGSFKESFILFSVRLPRIVITLLAGMALALSGCILQSITRNDLADPGIIGINSGAGVGIAIYFLFFPINTTSFIYILPLVAFCSALLTVLIIYIFSYKKNEGIQTTRFVLVGVGLSMALSGLMVVIISSTEQIKVEFIAKWLSGNIWGADWAFVLAILPWLVVLIPFTLYKANRLNILRLSEQVAIGVGISVEKERLSMLLASVALAASAVSVTGGISFVGLMAPHIARSLVGPRNQLYTPIALVLGGWMLLFADTIGRNIVQPEGISAGIMVSLIGAPYFIYLLAKK